MMGISVVTIDGDHHYEHVTTDFEIAVRLLKQGGRIVVDDTDVAGVGQAFSEFKQKFANRISDEVGAGGPTKVLFLKGIQ
jgi:cephalosporin hydroxylase